MVVPRHRPVFLHHIRTALVQQLAARQRVLVMRLQVGAPMQPRHHVSQQ